MDKEIMTPEEYVDKHPIGQNECYAALVQMHRVKDHIYLFKAMESYAKYYHAAQLKTNADEGGENKYCPECGDKRNFKVETDITSGRVCRNALCPQP